MFQFVFITTAQQCKTQNLHLKMLILFAPIYVPINEKKSNRISIAFNIMLKGKVGSSEEYQSAEF